MIETRVKIEGMVCDMCASHINDCIRNNFNVKKVKTSLKTNECVILSESKLVDSDIKKIVIQAGYGVKDITSKVKEKKRLFNW